ncbi:MAG: hypothetical protein H0V82_00005 [Candidatus Protochlamydia sp.]|nr:hypothetical protein [Candidatus Protochlamydia sp.]
MKPTLNWKDVIEKVKINHPHIKKNTFKYKHLIAEEAEYHNLPKLAVQNLALYLGIKLFPQPQGIPTSWPTYLCKKFLGQKYVNPLNSMEWVIVKQSCPMGKEPYIIHRTIDGFADNRWFYEIVPQLFEISNAPNLGIAFSSNFNEAMNKKFATQNKERQMTLGQVQAINLFFDKYVPSLEGVCSRCFQVTLPKRGAGERWLQENNGKTYEIRLSAAKPLGKNGQRTEYVSQTIIDEEKCELHALWDPNKSIVEYTYNMRQEFTHIPWSIYDYDKFNVKMPICICKGDFKCN